MSFGPVLFGDNQFIGVNHSSQAKATSHFERFRDTDRILEVLGWAHEAGIRDFVFTTHERYKPVFQEIVGSKMFPGLHFTPCLPYAHKYAQQMAETSMVRAVLSNLGGVPKIRLAGSLVRAAAGDFSGLMQLLVQIEVLMMKGLPIRGVFLLNIMFDLLLALGATRLIEKYHRFVVEELAATPGYFTMNHPAAVKALCVDIGLEQPWLCANLNVAGFRTNPSLDAVRDSFASGRTRNIAMSVFASGSAGTDEALTYVVRAAGVDCILFGSSRRENILRNTDAVLRERRLRTN
ncbi:MAG: hypothetical protein ABIQ86_05545 [Steroidobacteraceae bacterium]